MKVSKIKNGSALSRIASRLRAGKKKMVFTNGCFDILHVGHVVYLDKARSMGDVLIVGLNSDSSVRRIKGPSRPINREQDRARVLSALASVDYIAIFTEDTPENLIKNIRPDVLVKGGDWRSEEIAGAPFVKACGGRVKIVPFVKGFSTTSAIKKMSGAKR